jgi:hypothetical protein
MLCRAAFPRGAAAPLQLLRGLLPALSSAAPAAAAAAAAAAPPPVWTADHVHAALQLRAAAGTPVNGTFVVLTAAEAVAAAAAQADPKKPKKGKARPLTADGLSLEAFQLSDQANTLVAKGILTAAKVARDLGPAAAAKASAFTSFSAKAKAKAGARKDKGADDAAAGVADKVVLTGEVLLQSTEATEVDPYLLAVPMPILPLGADKGKGKGKGKGKSAPAAAAAAAVPPQVPAAQDFEHSFPSPPELGENAATAALAEKHFRHVVTTAAAPGTKRRLRDPHLLLYLAGRLDTPTHRALCASLTDPATAATDALPGTVKLALDLLGVAAGGSPSSQRAVDKKKRTGAFVGDEDEEED